MSSISIAGDTSGSVILTVPAAAGSSTITLPAGTGTAAVQGVSTNIVSGTAVASTSGTSINFTGIPSWVKRITVLLSGVSTNGTSQLLVQIGTSSGIETTGYLSYYGYIQNTTNINTASNTAGFGVWNGASNDIRYLPVSIQLVTGNTWLSNHASGFAGGVNPHMQIGGGNKTLSGTLDRVRITTVNGTDVFTAGTINIMYE